MRFRQIGIVNITFLYGTGFTEKLSLFDLRNWYIFQRLFNFIRNFIICIRLYLHTHTPDERSPPVRSVKLSSVRVSGALFAFEIVVTRTFTLCDYQPRVGVRAKTSVKRVFQTDTDIKPELSPCLRVAIIFPANFFREEKINNRRSTLQTCCKRSTNIINDRVQLMGRTTAKRTPAVVSAPR